MQEKQMLSHDVKGIIPTDRGWLIMAEALHWVAGRILFVRDRGPNETVKFQILNSMFGSLMVTIALFYFWWHNMQSNLC
jgi:hypothetical protein